MCIGTGSRDIYATCTADGQFTVIFGIEVKHDLRLEQASFQGESTGHSGFFVNGEQCLQRRMWNIRGGKDSHDRRYAIDARKLERELGWKPAETFDTGIRKTVEWYLAHEDWVRNVQSGAYRDWVSKQYGGA